MQYGNTNELATLQQGTAVLDVKNGQTYTVTYKIASGRFHIFRYGAYITYID